MKWQELKDLQNYKKDTFSLRVEDCTARNCSIFYLQSSISSLELNNTSFGTADEPIKQCQV